ncbi:MAG: hypothetical protein K9G59_12300 [Caulobacter sp.]|nr:hypothetical protein [Caulobacter sp.]
MLRLNGIVLSIATLLAAGPVLATPSGSIIDQFETSGPAATFAKHPDLARFTTAGSLDGKPYASLATETVAALARIQTMMSDVDTGWSDVIEVRVLTTSEADRVTAAVLIAADPRLAALPVSYRVVGQLPAARAKVGLDVLVRSKAAVEATALRHGPDSPATK